MNWPKKHYNYKVNSIRLSKGVNNLKNHGHLLKRLFVGTFCVANLLFASQILASNAGATSSITLTAPSAININIIPTASGYFVSSDTATPNISVGTDNPGGYTVTINSSANSNALVRTVNNTAAGSIPSILSSVSAAQYQDSSYAASNNLNNTWGIRPSTYLDANNTIVNNSNYLPAPYGENALILAKTASANQVDQSTSELVEDTYNLAIGARVNNDLAIGEYSGTYVITATINESRYSITYNKNTTDQVADLPIPQTGNLAAGEATLSSSIPTRTGYVFAGWCTDGSSEVSCNGDLYDPGDTIIFSQVSDPANIQLYAIWGIQIQSLSLSQCAALATDAPLVVYDSRDGSDYTVRYIAGACWMTQNLRLAPGSTLTPADSNVTTTYMLPTTDPNSPAYSATAELATGGNGANSYDEGRTHDSGNTTNGVWYNFAAASAGTITGSNNTNIPTGDICPSGWRLPFHDANASSGSLDSLISNLALFQAVNGGEYWAGVTHSTDRGYWWGSGATGVEYRDYLRYDGSLTVNDSTADRYEGLNVRCVNTGSYKIEFNPTSIVDGVAISGTGTMPDQIVPSGSYTTIFENAFTAPTDYYFVGWNTAQDGSGTHYGMAGVINDIAASGETITLYAEWSQVTNVMQEFTKEMCENYAASAEYTLYDSRDGSDYTVRYIAGACWMTQNLRLAAGSTLTPSDSNVATAYTLPTTDPNSPAYSATADLTSGNSYDEGRTHNSGNTTTGVWYNFAAASAGTITGESNSNPTTSDICPAGWSLPSSSEASAMIGYPSEFHGVSGGEYWNGGISGSGNGYWWTSTVISIRARGYIRYSSVSLKVDPSTCDRREALYVRCIRSN